jgi:hypothetical protein
MFSMFEFHGWATLRATATSPDDGWQRRQDEAAVEAVKELVDEVADRASFVGGQIVVQQVNGEWQVWFHGLRNHRQDWVVSLFTRIAESAPGSYGLLHVHDDEADDDNRWICWTMLRGQIEASTEERLTPHVGRVEDEPSYED